RRRPAGPPRSCDRGRRARVAVSRSEIVGGRTRSRARLAPRAPSPPRAREARPQARCGRAPCSPCGFRNHANGRRRPTDRAGLARGRSTAYDRAMRWVVILLCACAGHSPAPVIGNATPPVPGAEPPSPPTLATAGAATCKPDVAIVLGEHGEGEAVVGF